MPDVVDRCDDDAPHVAPAGADKFRDIVIDTKLIDVIMSDMKTGTRPYVMKARAETSAATRERILASTRELLLSHSFDDMTIEAIAEGAQTTVRTVLRVFSSKEELFASALRTLGAHGQAPTTQGDVATLLSARFDFYEKIGDSVIRWLADEHRLPAMHEQLSFGRQRLRDWVGEAFAATLAKHRGKARGRLHDALIVVLDVYTWKLLRRDFGLDRKAAQAVAHDMILALTRENRND